VAGAEQPGHGARGAVGQEDEHGVARQQDRRGHGQPAELRRAEVPDDRRVGQHVQRLGGQRPQGRDGEAEDLAIQVLHGHA
jgi:hypothetical protein